MSQIANTRIYDLIRSCSTFASTDLLQDWQPPQDTFLDDSSIGSSAPNSAKETQIIYPAGTNAVLWQADQKQQKIFQGSLEYGYFEGRLRQKNRKLLTAQRTNSTTSDLIPFNKQDSGRRAECFQNYPKHQNWLFAQVLKIWMIDKLLIMIAYVVKLCTVKSYLGLLSTVDLSRGVVFVHRHLRGSLPVHDYLFL